MRLRLLANGALAALVGAAMLTLSMGEASAFTLASPSLENSVASTQVDKVWWHHGWGWHGGWGWHHPWGWGAGWGGGWRACPPGFHLGPYGQHCWPNY